MLRAVSELLAPKVGGIQLLIHSSLSLSPFPPCNLLLLLLN